MTSLSDAYDGGLRTVVGRRRRLLGTTLFGVGTAMVTGAILLATTGLSTWLGLDVIGARHVAGVLAGLGLPAAVVGVFAALPASDTIRAAAAIGASVAVFGVALFAYAYPSQWLANNPALAVVTTAIYTLGMLVTFWCLFVAVATFKTRNDPGGTARVRITDEGTVRLVSTGPSMPDVGGVPSIGHIGGVGLFGSDPDGDVPTQTGNEGGDDAIAPGQHSELASEDTGFSAHSTSDDGVFSGSTDDGFTPEPTSDGGSTTITDPGADDIVGPSVGRGQPDQYCGNCDHFEYVRVDGSLEPYCGFHSELMDDMEACEQWELNK